MGFQDLKQLLLATMRLTKCAKLFASLTFDSAPCSGRLSCMCCLLKKKKEAQM